MKRWTRTGAAVVAAALVVVVPEAAHAGVPVRAAVATTAKAPASVVADCEHIWKLDRGRGGDDPGYLHAPGATNAVRSPDGTTTVTVWECLRRPVASGESVWVYGGPVSGASAGRLDVRLTRATQSSRVYWARWKVPAKAPNGSYGVTALVVRGGVAVDEFDGGFVVRRATRLRLDAGPEPVRLGGRVTVRVRASASDATGTVWAPFARRHVNVYFDPDGSAPRRFVRTVTTDAHGVATTSFPARRGGTWVARYGGTAEYFAPSASNRDHVAFVRR